MTKKSFKLILDPFWMKSLDELDFDREFLSEVFGNNFDDHDTSFSSHEFHKGLLPEGDDKILSYAERIFSENYEFDIAEYNSFWNEETETSSRTREDIIDGFRRSYGKRFNSRKADILNAKINVYKNKLK